MSTSPTASHTDDAAPTTRAEALRVASRGACPQVPVAAAFAWTKSLYAAIMPVRKKRGARPATVLAARVAELAGVDLDAVAALNAVPLTQHLDPQAAGLIAQAAAPLIPLLRAVGVAADALRPEAFRTQDSLAGRACTTDERDNFRTRVASAVLGDVVDVLEDDPALLTDETGLVDALRRAAMTAMADPADTRWGVSWIARRRRANGAPIEARAMSSDERSSVQAHSAAVRPELVRYARMLTRGDHATAEDLVQDTLLKLFCQGVAADRASFRDRAFDYLRKANADRITRQIPRDRVEQLVDWDERIGEGTGHSYDERTFGAASRAWSGRVESHDAQLDACSELDLRLEQLTAKKTSETQRALARELARIALEVRAQTEGSDELTDRSVLIGRLTRTALAAGAPSAAAARRAVTDLFSGLAADR